MRRGSTHLVIAAAVVAVAAVTATAIRSHAPRSPSLAALEARVLSRSIAGQEALLARNPANPIVGARLVGDHLLAFSLDSDATHLARAETIATRLAPTALDRAAAFARLSAARLAAHDFAGAFEAARTAVDAHAEDESAQAALFDAAIAVGEYATARGALDALGEHHTDSFAWGVREAQWLDAHGATGRAIGLLEAQCGGLVSRPVYQAHIAWCGTRLGDLERGRGDHDAARRWYGRALDAVPDYPAAIEGLAVMAHERGDLDLARSLYASIAADAHADIHVRLAEIARGRGDIDEARVHERAFLALATAPGAEPLHAAELARYLAEKPGRSSLAVAVAERDVARRGSVEAYATLAWTRFRNADFAGALEAAERARRWGAPDPEVERLRQRILDAWSGA